jgi:hypothetical protein
MMMTAIVAVIVLPHGQAQSSQTTLPWLISFASLLPQKKKRGARSREETETYF